MSVSVGGSAPSFEGLLAGGGTVSLEQFRGHPLLLVFLRHLG